MTQKSWRLIWTNSIKKWYGKTSQWVSLKQRDRCPYGTVENVTPSPAEPLTYNPIFYLQIGVTALSEQLWRSSLLQWMCVCSAVCHTADSSSVTRQHSFTAPPSSHQPPFASSSAAAVLDMSDRLIWQAMCVRRHRACALMCVCTAMSDRWCAYVVMSRAALQPFSPVPWEGFRWRHSSLNHPHSSSWSSGVTVSAAGTHPSREEETNVETAQITCCWPVYWFTYLSAAHVSCGLLRLELWYVLFCGFTVQV